MQGPTLSHHFHALGQDAAEPYLSLARSFAEAELPPMPEKERWVCMPGWTHYHSDGSWEAVNYPSEASQAMVFDVETLPYQGGHYPIMAVAVGNDGWYGWCSPWLTGDDSSPNHLIPFSRPPDSSSPSPSSPDDFRSTTSTLFERPQDVPRVFIGHNVLFDRARVASEYALRRPSTRFIDTLSLHVAVSGLTNPQRPGWLKYRKGIQLAEEDAAKEAAKAVKSGATKYKGSAKSTVKAVASPAVQTWKEVGSVNSLSEVARLHCGIKVDKSLRDILIDPSTTIEDVRHGFEEIMTYCALDVLTTLRVYRVLLPKFISTCPHPASFAGAILMSQPVLPVDRRWPQYVERAEDTYQKRLLAVKDALQAIAEDARTEFEAQDENGRYAWEDDIWLRQLDWSLKKARRLPGVVPAKRRVVEAPKAVKVVKPKKRVERPALPRWVKPLDDPKAKISIQSPLAALLFRTTWRTYPLVFTHSHGCLFAVPSAELSSFKPLPKETLVDVEDLGRKDELIKSLDDVQLFTVPTSGAGRCRTILGRGSAPRIKDGLIASEFVEMAAGAAIGKDGEEGTKYRPIAKKLRQLADEALKLTPAERQESLWLRQLDWASDAPAAPVVEEVEDFEEEVPAPSPTSSTMNLMDIKQSDLYWPRWFWDLDVPGGGLDITVRKRAVPLLLKLRWRGFPIVYSKAHGWIYRVPNEELDAFLEADNSLRPLRFDHVADTDLHEDQHAASFFKMPHPDGEDKNVGDPLSKPFVAAFEDGLLTSDYAIAKDALALNASCSYWRSARERIVNQMVVWEGDAKVPTPTPAAIAAAEVDESTNGLILPQVIPMGTVTRRAVEKTWLTAANAKKNRVGSELKSMVVAPPGYAIVGADVDSEELWICSVMGDAQFGIHGASAIGWMTLEGTKSAGTDLHSKSASILGISRDDAKVFNYSRIYGAGVKHAVQLLTKSNPALSTEQATKLAKNLYASTKGIVDRTRAFDRNFWHGGTESLVFNKLEQIAQSDRPRTPALGCGLTAALTKCFLPAEGRSRAGEGFMPSRINWVVQSSGVDYLHLLLVAMEYLTKRFEIDARYMISVHDEIRYLVKEEDKYRAAMALQVANVWTRSLFALRLQMPDLPQASAFAFSLSAPMLTFSLLLSGLRLLLGRRHRHLLPQGSQHDLHHPLQPRRHPLRRVARHQRLSVGHLPRLPLPRRPTHVPRSQPPSSSPSSSSSHSLRNPRRPASSRPDRLPRRPNNSVAAEDQGAVGEGKEQQVFERPPSQAFRDVRA